MKFLNPQGRQLFHLRYHGLWWETGGKGTDGLDFCCPFGVHVIELTICLYSVMLIASETLWCLCFQFNEISFSFCFFPFREQ